MINLDTVIPGDILTYRGDKCVVQSVSLRRHRDMSTSVSGIKVRMLEGEDEFSEPMICPGGFKSLDYWKDELNAKVILVFGEFYPNITCGKIYEVKSGRLILNNGDVCPAESRDPFRSVKDIQKFFDNLHKIIKVVEVVE